MCRCVCALQPPSMESKTRIRAKTALTDVSPLHTPVCSVARHHNHHHHKHRHHHHSHLDVDGEDEARASDSMPVDPQDGVDGDDVDDDSALRKYYPKLEREVHGLECPPVEEFLDKDEKQFFKELVQHDR